MLTAIMPVRNAYETLEQSLRALGKAVEHVPTRILLCDNGSEDGSREFLANKLLPDWLRMAGFEAGRALEVVPSKDEWFHGQELTAKNLEHLMAKFVWEIQQAPSDYVLRVDADVMMPKDGVTALLEAMKANPELGMLGLHYSKDAPDHVQGGCTLWPLKALEGLAAEGFSSIGCTCRWMHKALEQKGWTVEHLPRAEAEARHLKGA